MKKLCSEELKLLRTLLDLSLNQHPDNVNSLISDSDYFLKCVKDVPFIEKNNDLKKNNPHSNKQNPSKKYENLLHNKNNFKSLSPILSCEQSETSGIGDTVTVSSLDYKPPLTEYGENCSLTSLNSNSNYLTKPKFMFNNIQKNIKTLSSSQKKKKDCNNSGSSVKNRLEANNIYEHKKGSSKKFLNKSNSGMPNIEKEILKDLNKTLSDNSEFEINAEVGISPSNSYSETSPKKKKGSYFLKCKCFRSKKNKISKEYDEENNTKTKNYFGREVKVDQQNKISKEFIDFHSLIEKLRKSKNIIEIESHKGFAEIEKIKKLSKNIDKEMDKNRLQNMLSDAVLNCDCIFAEIKLQCKEIKQNLDKLSNSALDENYKISFEGTEKNLKGTGNLRVTKEGMARDYEINLKSKKSYLGKDGEVHAGMGSILRKQASGHNNNNSSDLVDDLEIVDALLEIELDFNDEDNILMDIRALFDDPEPYFDQKGDSRATTPQNIQNEEIPSASGSTEIQTNRPNQNNGNDPDSETSESDHNGNVNQNNHNATKLDKIREQKEKKNAMKDKQAMIEAKENNMKRNLLCRQNQKRVKTKIDDHCSEKCNSENESESSFIGANSYEGKNSLRINSENKNTESSSESNDIKYKKYLNPWDELSQEIDTKSDPPCKESSQKNGTRSINSSCKESSQKNGTKSFNPPCKKLSRKNDTKSVNPPCKKSSQKNDIKSVNPSCKKLSQKNDTISVNPRKESIKADMSQNDDFSKLSAKGLINEITRQKSLIPDLKTDRTMDVKNIPHQNIHCPFISASCDQPVYSENKFQSLFELDIIGKVSDCNSNGIVVINPKYLLHDVKRIMNRVGNLQNNLSMISNRLELLGVQKQMKNVLKE